MKAILTRCVVVDEPKAGGTVFYGTIERSDDVVNIRLPYSWPVVQEDPDEFLKAIKDHVAKELDIKTVSVDLNDKKLMERLEHYWRSLNFASGGLMGTLQGAKH